MAEQCSAIYCKDTEKERRAMKRFFAVALCVALCISMATACSSGESTPEQMKFDTFAVGYAKTDISPKINAGVMLVGNNDHTERLATEILEPLYATCAAFTDPDNTTLLLYGLDLHNTAGPVCQEVREKVSQATGIPGSHIQFNATHTHAGPSQTHTANHTVREYNEMFVEKCVAIALEALADRKPATMETGFTRPEELNYVRHYVMLDGTYRGKDMGSVSTKEIVGHTQKADNLLQVVRFNREEGKAVVLVNWQAHYRGHTASDGNDHPYTAVSADYPGVLRRMLNAKLDCETLFVLGASGNVASNSSIPRERLLHNDFIEIGTLLAEQAAAVEFQPAETGKIFLEENLFVLEGTIQQIPLYTFGFGDFAMALAPFEIFQQNAIPVRDNSKYKMTFYASCANASAGMRYLPSQECWSYYCYETGVTIHLPGTAEIIQDQLSQMLDTMFLRSGSQVKEKAPGYITEPYVPQSDGIEYVNLNPGGAPTEVKNKRYNVTLLAGLESKTLLVETREVAEQIMQRSTMKLLFDQRNVVVGIAE